MKKYLLILAAAGLVISGCGSSESEGNDAKLLADFYKKLNVYLSGGSPQEACNMIGEAQLEDSRSYAQAAAGGNLCRGALQENFSFLIDPDSWSLDKIEAIDAPESQRKQGTQIWIQPVRISMTIGGKNEEVLARSAAVFENGKIRSLDGMRLATVAPEQFARNIGSPTVISVDPVSAAYYSDKDSS